MTKFLNKIIDKAVNEAILENMSELDMKNVSRYILKEYPDSLNEMAQINTKEFNGVFPYNKFIVRIWSNDHEPPHFHVIADGWDIIVSIETGEIEKTKTIGKSSKIYTYVRDNVKVWLDMPSASNSKITNKERAIMQWDDYHPKHNFSIETYEQDKNRK